MAFLPFIFFITDGDGSAPDDLAGPVPPIRPVSIPYTAVDASLNVVDDPPIPTPTGYPHGHTDSDAYGHAYTVPKGDNVSQRQALDKRVNEGRARSLGARRHTGGVSLIAGIGCEPSSESGPIGPII